MPDTTPEPQHLRVLDLDTGHKLTIAAISLPHGRFKVLDEEPYDHVGQILPPEHNAEAPQAADGESIVDDNVGGDTVYAGQEWTKAKLEDAIAARNADRAEDDQIQVAPPSNKPELIAALVADDAN